MRYESFLALPRYPWFLWPKEKQVYYFFFFDFFFFVYFMYYLFMQLFSYFVVFNIFQDGTNLEQLRSRKSTIFISLSVTTLLMCDLDSTLALETTLHWSEIYFVYQNILQGLVFNRNWSVSRVANIITDGQSNRISFIKSRS